MISSRVAKHLWGENLYFGHRTLRDLVGHETVTGLMALAVSGRRPTDDQRAALDVIAVILTSADPRIWPLKITRLVSSYGGTIAGHCAGQLGIEGDRIGPWVIGYAASALAELRQRVGEGVADEVAVGEAVTELLKGRGRIPGYGVPLRQSDERMDALTAYVARTGRDRCPHWKLQKALSGRILERGVPPNVGIGLAAVFLDLGYKPSECSALGVFLHQNVFAANAVEAAQQRAPEMVKLPDECIDYVGPPLRTSPRAKG